LRSAGLDLDRRSPPTTPAHAGAHYRYVMKPVTADRARRQSQWTALLSARPFCCSHRNGLRKSHDPTPNRGALGVCPPASDPVRTDIPPGGHGVSCWRQGIRAYFLI
jgi:hypothetical protein